MKPLCQTSWLDHLDSHGITMCLFLYDGSSQVELFMKEICKWKFDDGNVQIEIRHRNVKV